MAREKVMVENLSIRFRFPVDQTKTVKAKTHEFVNRFFFKKKPRYFMALSDVNFTVYDGDIIGIIGPNGSGKTTLLRAISGIYLPDEGTVDCFGRVSTLLSLGTGFDNNLSGIDNILLHGLIIGMSLEEIERQIPLIVEFADIGEHIHVPMKYYSNGMISRVSFSVVLAMKPDILLIDEVFSVGDLAFQQKSQKAMGELLSETSCQLIVTHSLALVREHCNRAIYIRSGRLLMDGSPDEVVSKYERDSQRL
jgi:ABC-type polysaccharide/polyol phosphate transport system ATPase subunit